MAANELFYVFYGIGVLGIISVMAYFLYQIARMFRIMINLEERYCILEEVVIDKYAIKKGIDLPKEIMKRDMLLKLSKKRTFRSQLRNEMLDQFFGKEKKEE